jgi:CubicO group peptidase (beta-lactamase class C family)
MISKLMTSGLRRTVTLTLTILCLAAPASFAQNTPTTSAETAKHLEHVEAGLLPAVIVKGDPHPGHSLQQRMEQLHVPGVSIAVIHHGAIEWAQGFGVVSLGGAPVTADTLFQAGSISKPVAALAALKLVQEGKLSLDTNINTELRSWKLPDAPEAKGKPVTLRELLTHTGGTTVHGFPGYASDAPVPTLVQVLNGEKPANTPAIRIATEPGTKWSYSGGGITIMQQMMIDTSNQPFPKLLHDMVLAPIGMTHSTYEQPLPAKLKPLAATPYQADGKPVPGGAHTYPEMAAAGLWTTASDLARYAIEVQRSLHGEANHVLSKETTRQMLIPSLGSWGLGVRVGGATTHPYFTHGGDDAGFEAIFVAYEEGGDGAVVMTNVQGGSLLAAEVVRSIAAEYGWPDFQPVIRTAVSVDSKILADYVGTYQLDPERSLVFTLEDGNLVGQATGLPKVTLTPESPSEFFLPDNDTEIEFFKDAQGKVSYLVMHQKNAPDRKAMRK